MPRIRSIKPDFFTSEDVSALPLRARLAWIGLWTHCDDHGRTKDHVRLIKAAIWPLDDVSLADVEDDLITLSEAGRIVRYEVDGKGYLAIVNWHAHQSISKPSKARHPAPPGPVNPTDPDTPGYCPECAKDSPGDFPERSGSLPGTLPLGKEGRGKEGTRAQASPGSLTEQPGPEPPPRCPKHIHVAEPPACGACGDARRNHQAWERRQRDRPTPIPERPRCPLHPEHETGSRDCPACTQQAAPAPNLRALRGGR